MGRFEVEELDAHADTRLDDADDHQGFQGLPFAEKLQTGASMHGQRLAGTHKTAAMGNVGSHALHLLASLQINEFDVGSEWKTNSIAAVANARDA